MKILKLNSIIWNIFKIIAKMQKLFYTKIPAYKYYTLRLYYLPYFLITFLKICQPFSEFTEKIFTEGNIFLTKPSNLN